ncbi:MAG: hypothetical protein HY694_07385, partial [Deltaproteobacteria bacterium]|nr:hypothetical protein [Deltaproteobacteria bacterium]
ASINPDPKIFLGVVMFGAAPNSLLALLWRERIEVRVVRMEFALTLTLSRDGRGKLMM